MAERNPVLAAVREKALTRGGKNGIRSLVASFRNMDNNGDRSLSADEFRQGLRDWGIAVSDSDFATIVALFDRNGDGTVSIAEFIRGMRGPISQRRKTVIDAAFRKIDQNGNGVVDFEDVAKLYDTSRHPDVLNGRRNAAEVAMKFLSIFDNETNPDGKITYDEFLDYYAGVSASIDNDTHFELLLTRAWALDRPRNYKPADSLGMTATGQRTSTFGRAHPLYQTSTSLVGKQCENVPIDKTHNRRGAFTNKQPPPQPYSGLNTATTRSFV